MKALRLLGFISLVAMAWATPPTSAGLFKTAEIQANHEHKNVLLIFHASWCGWCHKLDGLLNSPEFKQDFDSSYVIVHVTVLEDAAHKADENKGGEALLESLAGGKDSGVPFFAIFDPKGAKLGDSLAPKNIGYPSEPSEVAHFMRLIKKTSHMSEAVQTKLEAFLSKKS